MDTQNLQPIINFIWSVADDVLINKYLENQYQDVILPMTVLRRLDLALEQSKEKVITTYEQFKSKIENLTGLLTSKEHGSGLAFYNTSTYTMKKLLDDPKNIDANLLDYLNGFSDNVQDIISKFKFRNQLITFEETGITFSLIDKFCSPKIELSPERISPMAMGYMFEDLIRRFNEKSNAAAGRHFTPREIIELMTHLVYLPVKDKIQQGTYLVYDPCAGSGAMLTQSKLFATNLDGLIKSKATFHLYGQENTGEMYAVCKSDMLLKEEDPDKIKFGSTLSEYGFDSDLKFNFMLTNPPYGTSWKQDIENLNVGTDKKVAIVDKRFNLKVKNYKGELTEVCLTTRSNDGQLMFMLHMLSKMKSPEDGGSRIASVHNGSALFTGDAGSSESAIRQYIIENDLLEAVISLPMEIFYNTGQPTYLLILTNNKEVSRKGKVQLIKADSFFKKRIKPLGHKKNDLRKEDINSIVEFYMSNQNSEYSKILKNSDFGYLSVKIKHSVLDFEDADKFIDYEHIPINKQVDQHLSEEVYKYTPNAKPDLKAIKVGYSVKFLEHFHKAKEYRDINNIISDIEGLETKSNGLLNSILA